MITRRHLSYGAVGANMRTNACCADVLLALARPFSLQQVRCLWCLNQSASSKTREGVAMTRAVCSSSPIKWFAK